MKNITKIACTALFLSANWACRKYIMEPNSNSVKYKSQYYYCNYCPLPLGSGKI